MIFIGDLVVGLDAMEVELTISGNHIPILLGLDHFQHGLARRWRYHHEPILLIIVASTCLEASTNCHSIGAHIGRFVCFGDHMLNWVFHDVRHQLEVFYFIHLFGLAIL